MRMIICTGSERPITEAVINRDNDLLFVSSVDGVITLYNCETGERLGTYEGHRGAVFSISVDYVSKYLISGGGDSTIRLWQINNGKELHKFTPNKNRVTSVDFSCGDKFFLGTTPQQLGLESFIHIYKNPMLNDDEMKEQETKSGEILVKNNLQMKNFKVSKALWSPVNDFIYAACSDGTIRTFDVEKQTQISSIIFDDKFDVKYKTNSSLDRNVTDMKYCIDNTCIIASSRNYEARLFDLRKDGTMKCVKIYSTDRGLNTVCVYPNNNNKSEQSKNGIDDCMCIAMGGGKTAQDAALKRGRGNYEVILKHTIFEETVGIIDPDCFSPLNTMTFNNDGSIFVCGFEEGTIRIFKMDANFEEQFHQVSKKFITETVDSDDDF